MFLIVFGVGAMGYLMARDLFAPRQPDASQALVRTTDVSTTPSSPLQAGEGGDTVTTPHGENVQVLIAQTEASNPAQSLPVYTQETLARYDGTDTSLPIYIAFEGNVYDVTAGKKFYEPGGAYHFLAGTDGTTLLLIAGGETIKKKYPIVGTFAP